MKTLAALTANGFGAVYIEVASVIVVDQLGRFFFFSFFFFFLLSSLSLGFPWRQLYTVRFFTDIATSVKVDGTGTVFSLTPCN